MANIKNSAEWIDFMRPAAKELQDLKKRFHIKNTVLEELKSHSARAHVEVYDSYMYLIYYFPVYDPKEETSRRAEIDFLITKNAAITVHYEPFEVLTDFKSAAEKDSLELTHKLIKHLLNFEDRQLRHIRDGVEAIANELFKDREKEVLKKISRLKRDISEYRVIVRHQGPILKSLLDKGIKFWGPESRARLDDLVGEHLKIVSQLEDYREAVTDFEETNNQLMNLKTTAVMKTFTTLSFLTFPFMLVVALLSMNAKDTPLIDVAGAFWIIASFMAITMITLALYFKKKGWF